MRHGKPCLSAVRPDFIYAYADVVGYIANAMHITAISTTQNIYRSTAMESVHTLEGPGHVLIPTYRMYLAERSLDAGSQALAA
jgi:hypothetical protein